MPEPDLDAAMLRHYGEGDEHARLTQGTGLLEFIRTQELLATLLPPPPAVVIDVGGGAGSHAAPLAKYPLA